MTTHTPGPWEVSGKAGWSGHNVIDRNKRSVASFPSSSKRSKEERDANARLIAAAPELLAALELMTATVEILGAIGGTQPANADLDMTAIAKVGRAAIVRATGEQHG